MSLVPYEQFKFWFLALGLIVVLSLGWWGYNAIEKEKAEEAVKGRFTRFHAYNIPPSFPDVKFAGPSGDEVSIKDFRGHYVVMNIWATWCRPCVEELPDLQRLQRLMKGKGMDVIALSADFPKDLEKVETFLRKHKLGEFARYHDIYGTVQNGLGIKALPMTYILNKRGRILYEIGGKANWDSPRIVDFLETISR